MWKTAKLHYEWRTQIKNSWQPLKKNKVLQLVRGKIDAFPGRIISTGSRVSSGPPLGRTCPVGTLYPGVDIMNDWTPHPIKSPSTHQGKLISPVCMHDVTFSPLKELTVKALTPKIGPRLIDLWCFSATVLHLVEDGCITLGQKTLLALGIN